MEKTYSIKTWQKVLAVFMAFVMASTIWGVPAQPAYAADSETIAKEVASEESGNHLAYDTAIGVVGNHALMTTRTSTEVDGAPSIQTNQAIVSANGVKSITSQRHQGAGSGKSSDVQIAGLLDNGNAVSVMNADGLFGVYSLNGHTIVPVKYVAVTCNNSGGTYYGVRADGSKMVLDSYSVSGKLKQTVEVGEGTPTNVAVYPGYVQVFASMPNPNSNFGGKVNGAKVFAITSDGLTAEPDIVAANANDDSGTVFMKTDGTVWYQPADGAAKQIASDAKTSARIEFLQANYAKIQYPKGKRVAYVTSSGTATNEGSISAMANRILVPVDENAGVLGDADMTSQSAGGNKITFSGVIAEINGAEFLWEDEAIVGYTPKNSEGACEFWVYSAENGKLISGPIESATQVKLERQGTNYAVTYTPTSGSQKIAGLYLDKNLNIISSNSAPSRLGGTLPDGRTIQVNEATDGTNQYYEVTDVYGNPIKCGGYTLALGHVEGIETQGAGSATPHVQHANTDLYCAVDANGKYGAVNSEGAVFVPFEYDNYYDLGYISEDAPLNNSDFILVHRDGQWFFFDVADAIELEPPAPAPAPQPEPQTDPQPELQSIADAQVEIGDATYNRHYRYPENITVTLNGTQLVQDRDYTVATDGGKFVGTYDVFINGIGNYTDTAYGRFNIVPTSTRITHLYKHHRGFKVIWNRHRVQTTGYEIRYSTDRNFRHNTHYMYVRNLNRRSANVNHLKAHKKYYVQVRDFKRADWHVYYSDWSKTRVVRTR